MALSRGQRKFAKYLSRYTGLSPRVVGAWELAEGNTTDWNKLNIGWTDSGRTSDSRHGFTNPKQGARTTAYWIRHKADPRIRAILNTAGHGPHRQIRAIWQSPWASGHYYGGSTLRSTYASIGGQLPNRPVTGRVRGGGGGGGGGRRGGGGGISRPQTPASVRTSLSSGGSSADSGIDAIAQRLSQSTNPPTISAPAPPPFAAQLAMPQGYQGDSLESGGPAPATTSIKEALASISTSGSGPQFSRSVHGGNGGGRGRVGRASRNGGPGESVSGGGSASAALRWAHHRLGVAEVNHTNTGRKLDVWESRFHMRAQPWCGIFVGNAVRKAGVHAPDGWAATETIAAYIRSKSGGFLGQVSQRNVKAGDIAVWNPGPHGHTGMVTKVYRDGSFDTIEGNAGDQVEINHHTSATVIGRPAYPGNHWGHHRRRGKH